MPRDKDYNIIICDQCGKQSEPDMRFCTYCGASLTRNPINLPKNSDTVISQPSAGNLLLQGLSSKTTEKIQPKPSTPTRVTPQKAVVKSTSAVKPKPQQKRVPKPAKQVIVDQKLKLQLLEHLKELNKLDRTLEASAIIRYRDHSVLASATSTRTSESLMVTITSTIYDICADSVKALGGGKIRILNITAENITMLLSPVNEDTVLIVVTNPKSNVGLISMYMEIACDKIRALI